MINLMKFSIHENSVVYHCGEPYLAVWYYRYFAGPLHDKIIIVMQKINVEYGTVPYSTVRTVQKILLVREKIIVPYARSYVSTVST